MGKLKNVNPHVYSKARLAWLPVFSGIRKCCRVNVISVSINARHLMALSDWGDIPMRHNKKCDRYRYDVVCVWNGS